MLTLTVPCVSALLGYELEGVAPVHTQPAAGVANLHPGELRRMADLHPHMLGGVAGAERCFLFRSGVGRLVVLANVPLGQRGVLAAVPGVERLVIRQMLLGHSGVVVDMTTFDVGVIRCMTLSAGGSGGRGFLHHGDHLTLRDDVSSDGTPPGRGGGLGTSVRPTCAGRVFPANADGRPKINAGSRAEPVFRHPPRAPAAETGKVREMSVSGRFGFPASGMTAV